MRYSKRCVYTVKGFNHGRSCGPCGPFPSQAMALCHFCSLDDIQPGDLSILSFPGTGKVLYPWNSIPTQRLKQDAAAAVAAAPPPVRSASSRWRSPAFASMRFWRCPGAATDASTVSTPARLGRCAFRLAVLPVKSPLFGLMPAPSFSGRIGKASPPLLSCVLSLW